LKAKNSSPPIAECSTTASGVLGVDVVDDLSLLGVRKPLGGAGVATSFARIEYVLYRVPSSAGEKWITKPAFSVVSRPASCSAERMYAPAVS
jgi:hypothetical protein